MQIPYQVIVHAHKAMDVDEAAAERGVPVRQIVKTLLVRVPSAARGRCPSPIRGAQGPERSEGAAPASPEGQHIIALVRGDQRLSLKKLARLVGAKSLEMAPAPDVPRVTGYQIGAVAPLGLRRSGVPIYVDQNILDEPLVSISAGRHDAGLELHSADLVRAVQGKVADITE
jgi:prolyl-tRNA editing enzyme YbaK/EbsC (Cys-tRNA(Pro) deacylase)